MADLVKCVVIGMCPIVGADGVDVNTGGTVMLDPEQTNVQALIYGGHVEPATKAAEKQIVEGS